MILLILATQVARITAVSHYAQQNVYFKKQFLELGASGSHL
jgi:hypothetical protein